MSENVMGQAIKKFDNAVKALENLLPISLESMAQTAQYFLQIIEKQAKEIEALKAEIEALKGQK